ncbi:hypothetical protein B0H14DRAFT_3503409 [Mycena olivaceomarginata]|nr:hypothetical protein B0H14DRAFT_3503409 [Mycena olivaceomarginata]
MRALGCISLAINVALVIGQAPVIREDKRAFAVLDPLGPFRNGTQKFEPTPNVNLTPPYFQVYDERFTRFWAESHHSRHRGKRHVRVRA